MNKANKKPSIFKATAYLSSSREATVEHKMVKQRAKSQTIEGQKKGMPKIGNSTVYRDAF